MTRVGFVFRLGASLIDIAALWSVLVFCGVRPLELFEPNSDVIDSSFGRVSHLLPLLISIGYTLSEVFFAGTLGKKALSLSIRNLNGSAATWKTLLCRCTLKNVGSLLFLIGTITNSALLTLLGALLLLLIILGFFESLSKEKLAFHDKLTKTAIFTTSDKMP